MPSLYEHTTRKLIFLLGQSWHTSNVWRRGEGWPPGPRFWDSCSGPAIFMVDPTRSNPLIICMLSCFSTEFVRKTPESTMPTQKPPRIPLPQGWPSHVQSGLLPILSLAHCAITRARGWAAKSVSARVPNRCREGSAAAGDRLAAGRTP
jgi:hypothetical protein